MLKSEVEITKQPSVSAYLPHFPLWQIAAYGGVYLVLKGEVKVGDSEFQEIILWKFSFWYTLFYYILYAV